MKKTTSIVSSAVVLLFSVVMLIYSLQYPFESDIGPGPGLLPFWLSLILMVLSIAYMVVAVKGEDSIEAMPTGKPLKEILFILICMVLYIFMLKYLGTVLAGTIFLFLLYRKSYKWYIALLISLGASVALFLLFAKLLNVNLPVNMFGF